MSYKIIIVNLCPPIPIRKFDWCVYLDGKEESGPCGFGETKEEATKDFELQVKEINEHKKLRKQKIK